MGPSRNIFHTLAIFYFQRLRLAILVAMLADWRIRVLSQALPWPRIVTDTLHQWLSHTVIVCTIPYCLQIIRHYIILHPMIEAIFSFIHCFREAANPRQSMWVFIVFIVIVESKRWAEKLRRSDALCQHQTPPRLRLKFLEFSQTWPGIRYLLYWRNEFILSICLKICLNRFDLAWGRHRPGQPGVERLR